MADQDLVLTPEEDTGAGPQLYSNEAPRHTIAIFDFVQIPSMQITIDPPGSNSASEATIAPVSKKQRGDYLMHRSSGSGPQSNHSSVDHNPSELGSAHQQLQPQLPSPTQFDGFQFDSSNHDGTPQHGHSDGGRAELADGQEQRHLGEDHMDMHDQQPLTDTVRDGLHLMAQERDSILQQVRLCCTLLCSFIIISVATRFTSSIQKCRAACFENCTNLS